MLLGLIGIAARGGPDASPGRGMRMLSTLFKEVYWKNVTKCPPKAFLTVLSLNRIPEWGVCYRSSTRSESGLERTSIKWMRI